MVAPLHAVIVSFPAQGHVNALMNLPELLAMRGFFITIVTTKWTDQRLLKAASKDAAARDREIQERGFKFRFLTFPDGLPPEQYGRTTEICCAAKIGPCFGNCVDCIARICTADYLHCFG